MGRDKVELKVKKIDDRAKLPTRGSEGAIGLDLYGIGLELTFPPHGRITIGTGLKIAVPKGFYGRIAPRSGLAFRHGIDVLGGVIDEDYRGEVKVILHNTSTYEVRLPLNKPIAQLILERAEQAVVNWIDDDVELDETERGSNGFGSSDGRN